MILEILTSLATFLAVIYAYFYMLKQKPQKEVISDSQQAGEKEEKEPEDNPTEAAKGDVQGKNLTETKENIDPLTFAEHIPSEVKKAKQRLIQKEIEAKMSSDEREKEREIQRQQLEAIYKLMQKQDDKFGIDNFSDMSEQMKYYM